MPNHSLKCRPSRNAATRRWTDPFSPSPLSRRTKSTSIRTGPGKMPKLLSSGSSAWLDSMPTLRPSTAPSSHASFCAAYPKRNYVKPLAVILLRAIVTMAAAQKALPVPNVSIGLNQAKGQNDVASSLQILALLTVLSLAPAILILTTSFSRIVIIFSFLRSALGTPSIPPNQVIIGLSLFLTFFVMGPTYKQINDKSLQPYMKKEIGWEKAVDEIGRAQV